MTDEKPKSTKRWRPRLSLLTALLFTALVACGVTIWQLWREVGPLRAENRRMRTAGGRLTIDDPKMAYGISVPTFEDDTWKWRIYLPPGGKFSLNNRSGHLPHSSQHPDKTAWFDAVRKDGVGSSWSGSPFEGEFMLEARILKESNGWVLVTRSTKLGDGNRTAGGGKTSIYQPSDDWLADLRSRMTSSDVAADQKSFEFGQPIMLLHIQRPVITETSGGGYSSIAPSGPADGVVLWIEQQH